MRRGHSVCSLAVAAILIAPAAATAQQEGTYRLGDITVSAPRLPAPALQVPAAVSVVTKEDIQLGRQGLGLDESLSAVPGVFMQNRYNFAQDLRVSIRGFGARADFGIRGVKILVDGIPLTLPDGQGGVDSIDLNSAERIEVIRGPASSLYGNASGGVILIESERGPEIPFAESSFQAGEFDLQEYTVKTGGQAGPLNFLVSGSRLTYGGFRDHSRTERNLVNGRFEVDLPGRGTLTAVANVVDSPVTEDPGALNEQQFEEDPAQAAANNLRDDAGESVEQQRVGFVYRRPMGADHEIQVRNHYLWRDFENKLPIQEAVAFERFFVGGGASYAYSGDVLERRNRLIVGLDAGRQADDRQRFDTLGGEIVDQTQEQTEKVTSIGVFAQDEFWLTPRLQLSAGLRYDRVKFRAADDFLSDGDDSGERTLDEVSPRGGALYTFGPQANVYANISTAFETPTTTEFANPAGGGFNPDLEPQTATNYELGIKGVVARQLRYELVGFRIKVKDELIPFTLEQGGQDFFRNAGESTRNGIELALDWRPVEGLRTSLAYTYSDFEFDDFVVDGDVFDGNTIPGIPEHVLRGEVFYRAANNLYAGIDAIYVGEQFADDANRFQADGYTVTNLRLGYQGDYGRWRVDPYLGVNNLFDEEYANNVRLNPFVPGSGNPRFLEPGPERNVYGGIALRYRFGP